MAFDALRRLCYMLPPLFSRHFRHDCRLRLLMNAAVATLFSLMLRHAAIIFDATPRRRRFFLDFSSSSFDIDAAMPPPPLRHYAMLMLLTLMIAFAIIDLLPYAAFRFDICLLYFQRH